MTAARRALQDQSTGLSGWGRTYLPGVEVRSENLERASQGMPLSRGLGRSYADSSLPAAGDERVLGTILADRILSFDESTGFLRVEAGLCLADLNPLMLRRGWFTPVTPGTKFVTFGGMVASDVHGKNHHVNGTFGRHVQSLLVRTGTGEVIECSREQHSDLFFATIGGMGLTGHILEVTVKMEKLPSPWIYTESYRISCLEELLERLKSEGKNWPMTVSWVDTVTQGKNLGRSILYVGRWATADEAPSGVPAPRGAFSMPFSVPSGMLNRFTIGLFNEMIYRSHFKKETKGFVNPDKYYYPLDFVHHWNRGYGSRGVTQHQSVIPVESGAVGIRTMIETLKATGTASFLTVIKDCGEEGEGLLSFPQPGMSLALDLPIGKRTQETVARLNQTVLELGGRVYLTKDGLSSAEDYRAMDPRVDRFLEVCRKYDPAGNLRSAQSERLFGNRRAPQTR